MSKNNKDANKPSLKSEARLMVNDNHGTESLCSNIDAIQEKVATVNNAKTSITELELHADHNQDSSNDAHLDPELTSKPNHETIKDDNQASLTAEPTTATKESAVTKAGTKIDIEDALQVEELGSMLPTPESEAKAGASNNTKASGTSTAANTDTGTGAVADADTGTVADTSADDNEFAKAVTTGKVPKQLNNHNKHDKKGSLAKKAQQARLGSQDEVGAGAKGGRCKWFRLRNVVGALSLSVLVGLGSIYGLMHVCAPDLSRFYDRSHSLYDKSGNIIYSSMNKDGYHRILTTQSQVDPLYIKMLIASEDERFYSHPGVDVISIGRALWSNITSGSIVSGASTIAMQVCRMLEPKERSIWSKAKEALGALYLTHYYGRDQILSLYLTLAPFGGNIEGVNAASYIYFNHSPKNLTPAEAALLVALPRSPEVIRPDRHPKSARYYRNEVLKKAVTDKIIKQDILAFATKEPIPNVRHALPQDAYYLGQSIFTSKLITPEIKALRELTARIIGKQVISSEQDTQSLNISQSTKDNQGSKEAVVGSNQDQSPTLGREAHDNSSQELASAKGNTLGQELTASANGAQLVVHNQEQKETINQVIEVQLSGASIKPDQYEAFNKAALQDGLNQFVNVYSSNLGQEHGNSQGQSLGSHSTEFERKLKMLNSLGPLPRELYTTIDPRVQELLINAVEEYRHSFLGEDKQDSLSIVVVDNDIFEVLGYVGALGTDISYVDSALALRSPGSALKPFAYALAFDQGLLHPNSILLDKSQIYDGYQPRNYDRQFYGELTAAKALQASLNLPAVEVMRAIGPDNFINMINNTKNDLDLYDHSQELNSYVHGALVLPKQSKPSLSLVLGGCGISLFDLTQLYASLAHDGASAPMRVLSAKRPSSAMVRKHNYKYHFDAENNKEKTSVRTVGNKPERGYQSLKENHIHYQTMVRPAAARATYNILQGTPAPFGFGNNYFSLGPKVSYKTGTSYKNRDAWALGSSNNITVGVWTGRNDGSPSYQRTGFNHAAPILFKVITKLTSNDMRKKRIEDDVLLHARPPMALSKIQVKQLGLVTKKEDGYQSYNANLTNDTKDNQVHKFGSKSTIEPLAIAFPTDNSRLSLGSSSEVLIKFSGGKAPYYVLINDELNDNLESFKPTHDGFYQITIIDSLGNSVSSQVYVQGLDQ